MRATRTASVLLTVLALVCATPTTAAAAQGLDLSKFPRVDPDDLPPRYRDWLQKEVVWIITDDERDVFLRLDSDERRDRFIEEFWRNRDPSPGTERNEYRELHYERLRYANRRFGRDTPREGWQTDMGHMFILLGEPRSISRLPNTQEAVPAEVWFYAVDPALGLPPFFYLVFFKENGVGEYRLWSPAIDGPQKLLNVSGQLALQRGGTGGFVPGAQSFGDSLAARAVAMLRRADQELAAAAASLIPGEGGDVGMSPLRSEMVLSRVFDLPDRLMPSALWAFNVLTGVTESRVRFETLPLSAEAIVLRDPDGEAFLHVVTRAPGEELNLNHYEDRYYLTFQVSTAVRDDQLRFLTDGEPRTLQADIDQERARSLRDGDVEYMERLPIVPGAYTVDLMVENNVSGEFARMELPVSVPEPGARATSAPFLVLESRDLGARYDPYSQQFPFQVGSRVVIPALDGPFPIDGTLQVFWQIGLPADRLAPVLATYEIRDADDRVRVSQAMRVDPDNDGDFLAGRLDEIDLAGLPAGSYTLVADVEDDGRPADRLPFRIAVPDSYERPFVHANPQPPPGSPEVRLARARQLRTIGRTDDAIAELEDVLRREPDLEEALKLQIELLTDAGRLEQLQALIEPRLVERPNDPQLLLTLAETKARLGQHYDAIRYYERARLGGAEETPELLDALASEYYAEGQLDETRRLLERSLELDPDQPQMRRLLERLREDS